MFGFCFFCFVYIFEVRVIRCFLKYKYIFFKDFFIIKENIDIKVEFFVFVLYNIFFFFFYIVWCKLFIFFFGLVFEGDIDGVVFFM